MRDIILNRSRMDDDGRFVVAWESEVLGGATTQVMARMFDTDGTPSGAEFGVNSDFARYQTVPSIAVAASGWFVVAWKERPLDVFDYDIRIRAFDSEGRVASDPTAIAPLSDAYLHSIGVATIGEAGFVVTWGEEDTDTSESDVVYKMFDATGASFGPAAVAISDTETGNVSVAATESGVVQILWAMDLGDGNGHDAWGLGLDTGGGVAWPEARMNSYLESDQVNPVVSSTVEGRAIVAWMSDGQDGDADGVFAQRLDASGRAVGLGAW